jgi:hypothetical protein
MTKLFACALIWSVAASAQFGREGTWMTSGGNAQRSAWIRTDTKITKASVSSGFQLLWKIKLDQKESSSLTQPLIMDRYIGYQGFRSFALLGGADAVYAVDTDLNRVEWQNSTTSGGVASGQRTATSNCLAGTSASVALPTTVEFPAGLPGFGAFGRAGAAKSGVGEPYQGAVTLAATPPPRPLPARSAEPPLAFGLSIWPRKR